MMDASTLTQPRKKNMACMGGRRLSRGMFCAVMCLLFPLAADAQRVEISPEMAARLERFDARVESGHQAVLAAQVSGSVVQVLVHAGDHVTAGQVLLRLDSATAIHMVEAGAAQSRAAQARLAEAGKDYSRAQILRSQDYISQAAMDKAEAHYQSLKAQAEAALAQAQSSLSEAGHYTIRAPFDGTVIDVPVTQGDMAMPGRFLVSLYDPRSLRITADVPQGAMIQSLDLAAIHVEVPGLGNGHQWLRPLSLKMLPSVNPETHTEQVRVDIEPVPGILPGEFARLWMPSREMKVSSVWVPVGAIVHRAEMTGVYVRDQAGRSLLRQVRTGQMNGDQVEILSGVSQGEQVIPDARTAFSAGH